MQTITVAAASQHGPEFTTLAALAISIVVVGLIAWHFISRTRLFRDDEHLGHRGH